MARVIHAAIIRHDLPRSELREIVQEAGQLEIPKLERFLGVLATLAYLAPFLGLLGTVAGMIEAFGVITSNGGYATVTELSGGIYKSLLTTAAGLVVATPTFVAYSYLSSRVNTLMHDMERAGIEIVQMLTETEPESGIISFQPSCRRAASAIYAAKNSAGDEIGPNEGISVRVDDDFPIARRRVSNDFLPASQLEFRFAAGNFGQRPVLEIHVGPTGKIPDHQHHRAEGRFIFAIKRLRSMNSGPSSISRVKKVVPSSSKPIATRLMRR